MGEEVATSLEPSVMRLLKSCRVGLEENPLAALPKVLELEQQVLFLQQQLTQIKVKALKHQLAARVP